MCKQITFKDVSAGYDHSLALSSDGFVYAWGNNSYGQLGIGEHGNSYCPTQVKEMPSAVLVSAGKYHSLALSKDSSVYAWGGNSCGQLGDALRALLVLGNKGKHVSTPFKVESLFNVVGISANGDHSLALSRDGFVYAWGRNDYGQLGDGTGANRSVPVCIKNFFITKKLANEDEDNDLLDKLLSNADMLQKNLS